MKVLCTVSLLLTLPLSGIANEVVLFPRLHHLRNGNEREWDDFPKQAETAKLAIRFQAARNPRDWTLRLRHQDVRQTWKVVLNGKELSRLRPDENDMVVYISVPAARCLVTIS
jgi:hypothetical protein